MACLMTLQGIPYSCEANLSGVKNVWLNDWNNVTVDVSTNDLLTVTLKESANKFKKYVFAKNTGSLTKTMTKDESKGTLYYTNELTGNFNKMDMEKKLELDQLASGQIAGIVEDMNGNFWYLGKDNYASASAVTGQTGAATDDGNFYALTVTDYSATLPYAVDPSIMATIAE